MTTVVFGWMFQYQLAYPPYLVTRTVLLGCHDLACTILDSNDGLSSAGLLFPARACDAGK